MLESKTSNHQKDTFGTSYGINSFYASNNPHNRRQSLYQSTYDDKGGSLGTRGNYQSNDDLRGDMESNKKRQAKYFSYYNNGETVLLKENEKILYQSSEEKTPKVDVQNIKVPAIVHFKHLLPHQNLITSLSSLLLEQNQQSQGEIHNKFNSKI